MWAEACGAEHTVAGPEYTHRDFTPEELLQAGKDYATKALREARYPTAWDRVLRGDD
jgi:hypothetical protein